MSSMEMRAVFASELKRLMIEDKKVVVIDADLAKASGTWTIRDEIPDRALDVGIAEQNMVSVAAGLSSYGYKPFVTSFSPFVSRRVCDQVTLSGCYAKQNIKIVGTDPGISAELNGGTHMGIEDIGVLRSIPNIVIFEPVDEIQLRQAMPIIKDYYGVLYLRLFRKPVEDVFTSDYKFDLFKADYITKGSDVTIFSSGMMTQESIKAVEMLKEEGISVEHINIHTIKPIDEKTIIESLSKTKCAVTAENHNVIGGLFSAVSEVVAKNALGPVEPIGILDKFGEVGKLDYLKEKFNMTANDIVKAAKKVMKLKK